jgi:SAM-dependent methyltransferase
MSELLRSSGVLEIMPSAEIYEKECEYIPWKETLDFVINWVSSKAQTNSRILDLCCGPGFVLNEIESKRSDLFLYGIDKNNAFIEYASARSKRTVYICEDAISFKPSQPFDVVLCTSGLHHLPYHKQENFLQLVSEWLSVDGIFVVGEIVLAKFTNPMERKIAALNLGARVLEFSIEREAPDEVVGALINVMRYDIFETGEFKLSDAKLTELLSKRFSIMQRVPIWRCPGGEDCVYLCKPRNEKPCV